ncbi:MAG: 3-deoxy-7-phosphoheptulonate synthase [bacterium]|nr:3-deoxy-7-phosphoheptulonate synthase [bacterium]
MEMLRDQNIEMLVEIDPPEAYLSEFPVVPKVAENIMKFRRTIRNILSGLDQRLLVIVGPCSIHDEKAGLEYAQHLANLAQELQEHLLIVMRVYFAKPRTTVGWKGLINEPNLDGIMNVAEGLRRARQFLLEVAELGLPAATEWLDLIDPQYLADLVSWGAIGARTTESQTHRELASGLSMPVGFKNGTGGTRYSIQIAVNGMIAASKPHVFKSTNTAGKVVEAHTKGNPGVHAILRGGERGSNYDSDSVLATLAMLKKANFPPRLLIDCSHDNSGKDYSRQSEVFRNVLEQRLGGNEGVSGMMLESHLFEGKQPLNGGSASLRYGVSITDGCIGWEETEELLREAHRRLAQKIAMLSV